MTEYIEIQDRLKQSLPDLPKTLRSAATYMLDRPGDIATLSMRKVAENAGVSVPNFDRLAKSLGFGTYGEMREVYQQRVQNDNVGDYHLRAQKLQKSGETEGPQTIWTDFRQAARNNIEKVYDSIRAEDAGRIAETLSTCPRIYVAGAQASRSLATYLSYVGAMASPKFRLLGRNSGLFADDLVDVEKGDALVAIGIRPCARTTVEVAKLARERGCRVIGITDSQASPLAVNCDDILLTPTESPMFFESYLGTLAIIELLVTFLTMQLGEPAVERMEDIEGDRQRLGETWQEAE